MIPPLLRMLSFSVGEESLCGGWWVPPLCGSSTFWWGSALCARRESFLFAYGLTSVLKQCTVQVKLELGHRAQLRKKPTTEGFTHDWMVFVRGPEQCDIQHFVERVVFRLHESFPKPKRGECLSGDALLGLPGRKECRVRGGCLAPSPFCKISA